MLTRLPDEFLFSGTPFSSRYTVMVFLIGAFVAALRVAWLSAFPPDREPATFGMRHSLLIAVGFAAFGAFEGYVAPQYLQSIMASDERRSCGSMGVAETQVALYWWNRTQYWSRYAFRCSDGRVYTGTFPYIPR